MAAQANIVINDGATTPVAKTFSARGADLALAQWKDISSGIPIGFPTITIGTSDRKGTNGSFKTEIRVSVPVLEVISGSDGGYTPSPKVAYTMFGKVELTCPNRGTQQNRKDLLAFVKNLMAHSVVSDTVVDFNPAV